jgi:hypothetical protein
MKRRFIGITAAVTFAAVCGMMTAPVEADFVGIKVENVSNQYLSGAFGDVDGLGFNQYNAAIFELYANFDNVNDNVMNVFGAEFNASHPFFHQTDMSGKSSSLPWKKSVYDFNGSVMDSYVTIGFQYESGAGNPDGPDANTNPDALKVSLDPAFDEEAFLSGNTIDDPDMHPSKGAGWFTTDAGPNNIQGKAGTYPDMKVLLGRFSFTTCGVLELVTLMGKLKMTYKNGAVTSQTGFLQFSIERLVWGGPCVPAPPVLIVTFLVPLLTHSRRRASRIPGIARTS